jgi:uncharacterized delta-60 repeat protein
VNRRAAIDARTRARGDGGARIQGETAWHSSCDIRQMSTRPPLRRLAAVAGILVAALVAPACNTDLDPQIDDSRPRAERPGKRAKLSLTIEPAVIAVARGASATVTVRVRDRELDTGVLQVTVLDEPTYDDAPPEITVPPVNLRRGEGSAIATIHASRDASPRRTQVTFVLTSTLGVEENLTVPVDINAGPGGLDPSFGKDGVVTLGALGSMSFAPLRFLPDGKIMLVSDDGARTLAVRRLNADGTVDATFGPAGGAQAQFSGTVVLPAMDVGDDGAIFVASNVTAGGERLGVARFDAAGALDTAFGGNGRLEVPFDDHWVTVHAIRALPDGGVVIGGTVQVAGTTPETATFAPFVRRFSRAGVSQELPPAIETTLRYVGAVAARASGEIVIAGATEDGRLAIFQLASNGGLAPSFGVSGLALVPWTRAAPSSLLLRADGRIVLGGADDQHASAVVLLADGTLDPSFDPHSAANMNGTFASAIALDASGRLLVAGETSFGPLLQRWRATGAIDTSFRSDPTTALRADGATSWSAIAVDAQGRIVTAGRRSGFDGGPLVLARFLP